MFARFPRLTAPLAACFLAILAPAAPAAQPKAKMVRRSYAVADLVVPLPGTEGAPACEAGEAGKTNKPGATLEDRLIQLIVKSIRPASWQPNGGRGTIDYYPLGMTLVIRQTPDVQKQVAELLADLRKPQDTEVALEVRFLTLSEGSCERLGLDFMNQAPANRCPGRPGPDAPPAPQCAEGSCPQKLGPAFLNDTQVLQLMEAVQGDRRANVMQAPKVTLFSGQEGKVNITDTRFFLTGVDVVHRGAQTTVRPKNEPATTGLCMTARPVVSADRRFVQLYLKIDKTDLASAAVPVIPVAVADPGDRDRAAPVMQFLQQPQLTKLVIEKNVAVPDGGTAVFGGFKKVCEVQSESGPPVLSNIPYVNRLFKNVGYGRETQQVLVLVTPRVIVTGEVEEKAGVASGSRPAEPAVQGREAPGRSAKVLVELLKAYDEACAAGRPGEARKLARAALALDPTCFRRAR
jgi:general secretion pathway protein D